VGTFTFETAVASGAPYSATVAQQTTNPAQTCVVTNASGVMTSEGATNVSVTCTTDWPPISVHVPASLGPPGLIAFATVQPGSVLSISASGSSDYNGSAQAASCVFRPCRSPVPGDADHLFRPRRSPRALLPSAPIGDPTAALQGVNVCVATVALSKGNAVVRNGDAGSTPRQTARIVAAYISPG
jgi:hypothetical protein